MLTRRALLFGAPRSETGEAISDLRYSEDCAAAIEYGLIASLIAVITIGALNRVGRKSRRNLNCVKRAVKGRAASRFCERRGA